MRRRALQNPGNYQQRNPIETHEQQIRRNEEYWSRRGWIAAEDWNPNSTPWKVPRAAIFVTEWSKRIKESTGQGAKYVLEGKLTPGYYGAAEDYLHDENKFGVWAPYLGQNPNQIEDDRRNFLNHQIPNDGMTILGIYHALCTVPLLDVLEIPEWAVQNNQVEQYTTTTLAFLLICRRNQWRKELSETFPIMHCPPMVLPDEISTWDGTLDPETYTLRLAEKEMKEFDKYIEWKYTNLFFQEEGADDIG
jgi:hypothetical protein